MVPLRRLLHTARTSGPDIADGGNANAGGAVELTQNLRTARSVTGKANRRFLSHECIQAITDIVVD